MRRFPGTDNFMGPNMLFGVLGFLGTLLLIALIVTVVVLARRRKHPAIARPNPLLPPALQLLDERLARGEIEIDDYLNRKAAMLGAPTQAAEPTAWLVPGQDPARANSAEADVAGQTSAAEG